MTDEFSLHHRELIERVPEAPVLARDVEYDHDGTALRGYEAVPAGEQRRPAVLVVHDWTGLREYPKARAQMLARLGYHAFALDVYGAGRVFASDDMAGASAEAKRYYSDPALLVGRVRAAYDLVAADPRVDPERIAIVGYCFGGTAALEFSRTGAPLVLTGSFHGNLVAHEPAEVDGIRGSMLIATGAEDPLVPDEAIVAFENELRSRADLDWQVLVYSGAPHAFTLPGTPAYRADADRRSWAALMAELAHATA
ncbi:dienelactone hydrolase family protein [Microbacterium sp. SORGH_AS_0888]|uniref:dienelactone hydrolase family protein n=1 Tax=Microbacterium sp. SORGH_AS_0888 TaxID=3041791 RepID=UPI0027878960|nr:dienelactone hydrolase family protein [Microbacterium sp. SORGH_AS_0888]MDQ1128484.1 dienelactone hydrolase [Microbacterium sp. SORGH_AS_0888]